VAVRESEDLVGDPSDNGLDPQRASHHTSCKRKQWSESLHLQGQISFKRFDAAKLIVELKFLIEFMGLV